MHSWDNLATRTVHLDNRGRFVKDKNSVEKEGPKN